VRISLTVTAGPARGQAFTFDEPDRFLFGRAADARVSLPHDPYVSRQHFLLEIAPPSCRVTDLDSKNGLFVNGVRYGGRKPPGPAVRQAPADAKGTLLEDGDEIAVGDTRMKIAIEVDVVCVDCGKRIPDEHRKQLAFVGGSYLCQACRAKQAERAKPPPVAPAKRAVQCTRCRKDVTDEAGSRGQAEGVRYVCKACRDKEKANPQALLGEILGIEPDAAPALPGAPSIRGYRIDGVLGAGGMGVVYKATAKSTGRAVAIKTMLPNVAASRENVDKFLREVDVTRQLAHPNIVALLDHGNAQGTFYVVLEFVDGMDLEKYLEKMGGKLDLQTAAPLMMGILAGLGHAHSTQVETKIARGARETYRGIVHRDLKPTNILLARNGKGWTAKVADFGLAKSFESAGLTDMTAAGQICGTPIYWPREQITHYISLAPPTDVFSIGAVFHEILIGQLARDGFPEMFERCKRRGCEPGAPDYMNVIASNPIAPLRQRNPAIPKRVADVLDRAVREAEVPNDGNKMRHELAKLRYPDAGAFREALGKALSDEGIAT
jgi:serine/threonine protein kinase